MKCAKCPPHSSTHEDGSVNCRCENNYFRADKDPPSMACTREQFCCNPCLHVCFIYFFLLIIVFSIFLFLAFGPFPSVIHVQIKSFLCFTLHAWLTTNATFITQNELVFKSLLTTGPLERKKKKFYILFQILHYFDRVQGRLQAWDLRFYFSIPSCYVLVIGHREKELRFIKLILRFS